LQELAARFQHPDARVQQRLEVLWLISPQPSEDGVGIFGK
jgi:hypothetical protein